MAYTKQTWTTGDTVTASKLNHMEDGIAEGGGGASWDAVIRLVHAANSNQDSPSSLTPSIASGTFADLYEKYDNGGCPSFLIEYKHQLFNTRFSMPMGYVTYVGGTTINILVAGYSVSDNAFKSWGTLVWWDNDTLSWQ